MKERVRGDGHKQCLGTLFFSSRRYDSGAPPICAGWLGTSRVGRGGASSRGETIPAAGEWRFACVGVSEYDQEGLRDRRGKTDVELPKCSGLEIVSASAPARQREILPVPVGPADDASLMRHPHHRADRRKSAPEDFAERFLRSSRAILDRAGANARYMAQYVDRFWTK